MTTTKKILCLPGYLQSGKIFSEKLSGVRKLLGKQFDIQLDCIDPANPINSKDEFSLQLSDNEEEAERKWKTLVEEGINRCWWDFQPPHRYDGFEKSLNHVISHIKENGPYHGILGYSQGAAMAAVVTSTIHELLPTHPDFQLAIFFSGFVFTEPVDPNDDMLSLNYQVNDFEEYKKKVKLVGGYEKYFKPSLNTQVINVYGTGDNIIPSIRSRYLSTLFNNGKTIDLIHDGRHYIPHDLGFLEPAIGIIEDAFEVDIKSNL